MYQKSYLGFSPSCYRVQVVVSSASSEKETVLQFSPSVDLSLSPDLLGSPVGNRRYRKGYMEAASSREL